MAESRFAFAKRPQPELEASVVTTFLLQTIYIATLFSIQWRSFQGARAVTQAWLTLICRHPWHHTYDGTCCFSQRWRGRMRSRQSCSTGDAAAMRPSILWNILRGWVAPISKEVTSSRMAKARSDAIMALIWVESRTVPRNNICWLGDRVLLAMLTQSPRRSRWLRRTVLCDKISTSDWGQNEPVVEVVENKTSYLSQRQNLRDEVSRCDQPEWPLHEGAI